MEKRFPSSRVLAHLRGNLVAYIALFVALGTGTAMAANTVFSTDIVNGEVKSADILDEDVRTVDILNGAVQTSDIRNDDIRSVDVRDDSSSGGGLNGADLTAASQRSSATYETPAADGSKTELTSATITPQATGHVSASLRGFCNFSPGLVTAGKFYNLIFDLSPTLAGAFDAVEVDNWGVVGMSGNGSGSSNVAAQLGYTAERVFSATAGTPLTVVAAFRREYGVDGGDTTLNCSGSLLLRESLDRVGGSAPAEAGSPPHSTTKP